MKNRFLLILIALFGICLFSCREDKPKREAISWSPDGKKLALININSQELLIVSVEKNQIGKIVVLDDDRDDKTKICTPQWSADGQFLLYNKVKEKSFTILVYSLLDSTITKVDAFELPSKDHSKILSFPQWMPSGNRIFWVAQNGAENRIYSALPNGHDSELIMRIVGERLVPQWSLDGKWLFYSLYVKDGDKRNGLWKKQRNSTGQQQIYQTNVITRFALSPDNQSIALIKEKKDDKNFKYEITVIDSAGGNEKLILKDESEIAALEWQSDGQNIIFVDEVDSLKNIWKIELPSRKRVKLTFDTVKDFFGMADQGQFFFTIQPPHHLVRQAEFEKEAQEFFEVIRGIQKENKLIRLSNFNYEKLGENIYVFSYNSQAGAAAYFKSIASESWGSGFYLPSIEFSDGSIIYIARTNEEQIAAADEFYVKQKYQQSLLQLNHYWNIDLDSMKLWSYFDADSIIAKNDSIQITSLLDGLKKGTLLKTILVLRRLHQDEKADWLFDQLTKLALYYLQKEQKENKYDELIWSLIGAYAKYDEFDAGIKDLDALLQIDDGDSTFQYNVYFAQSLLAFESRQYRLAADKLKASLLFLPEDSTKYKDFHDLLSLELPNIADEYKPFYIPVFQELIRHPLAKEKRFEACSTLGDLYRQTGKMDKALEAYQTAVMQPIDEEEMENELWGRIFKLELSSAKIH